MLFNFSFALLMSCQIDLLVGERGLQMWLCIFISLFGILIIIVLCIFTLCFQLHMYLESLYPINPKLFDKLDDKLLSFFNNSSLLLYLSDTVLSIVFWILCEYLLSLLSEQSLLSMTFLTCVQRCQLITEIFSGNFIGNNIHYIKIHPLAMFYFYFQLLSMNYLFIVC